MERNIFLLVTLLTIVGVLYLFYLLLSASIGMQSDQYNFQVKQIKQLKEENNALSIKISQYESYKTIAAEARLRGFDRERWCYLPKC